MTFTANQRLTIFLFFILSLHTVALIAYNVGKPDFIPLSERIMTECEILDVSDASGVTEDVAAILRSNGYYGIPFDGGEILYSDACIGEGYIP